MSTLSSRIRHRVATAMGTLALASASAIGGAVVGGPGPAGASTKHAAASDLHIAYFTDALDNVYLTTATKAAKQMAKKYGAHLSVFSANWNSNTQVTQIQDAVSSGKYQALVVEADDGQAVCTPLTDAAQKGLIVSIYNAPICGHGRTLYTPGTVGYFGGNDYQYGKLMGEEMIKALKGKGTVAYVSGPTTNSIVQVTTQGLVDELKTAPGIHLVAQLNGEWTAAKGLTATQDLVQAHPTIDGIVYGVDQMAIPSVTYLKQDGKIHHIKVVSEGATTNAATDINKGYMYASIVQLPAQEAAYAVEAAIQTYEKKPVAVPGWNKSTHIYNVLVDPSLHGSDVLDRQDLKSFKPEWSV